MIGLRVTIQQDARQLETENDRAQDVALQAYLDQMSTLLIAKDLRASEGLSEVRTLARARTLTVLRRLDSSRKTEVMRFLIEARPVQAEIVGNAQGEGVVKRAPVISLASAVLSDADLSSTEPTGNIPVGVSIPVCVGALSGAALNYADLSSANLSHTLLQEADLTGANLRHAKGII